LSYGAFRNRFKQVAVNAGATETTLYIAGLLEKITRGSLIEYRHLIHGGKGTAAIHTRRSGGTPAVDTVYVHSDHLGSPELLTSASGGELLRLSFGAYGERRDGSDWDGPVSAADLTKIGNTGRHGFTGHEHLDAVGLIHMNGRVYEPVAGRFLSRDPIIDGFDSSQGPNGFAYVHNNPLAYTDPSGFSCDPPAGMTDAEAQAYITQCEAAYESGGWGAVAENERWCAMLDIGCQQQNWLETQASFYDAVTYQLGRDWEQNQQGVAPNAFQGDGILVTASRYGGYEQMSWLPSIAGIGRQSSDWVSATLADGSRGYLSTSFGPNSTQGVGPLPGRGTYQPSTNDYVIGGIAVGSFVHMTIEFVERVERSPVRTLVGRIGPVLAVGNASYAFRNGNYVDGIISGGIALGGFAAFYLGSAPLAAGVGAFAIGYFVVQLAFSEDGY